MITVFQRSMIRELPDDQSGLRLQLSNFVGNESLFIFYSSNWSSGFMEQTEGFCDTKKLIDNHLVVNDTAKCGIKLITDLNTRIVKDLKFTYLNAKYVMLNF